MERDHLRSASHNKRRNPVSETNSQTSDSEAVGDQNIAVMNPNKGSRMKNYKNLVNNLAEMNAIMCVGDSKFALKYYLEDNFWHFLPIDEKKTTFHGGFRYSSLAAVS